jgi:hypothetical protein
MRLSRGQQAHSYKGRRLNASADPCSCGLAIPTSIEYGDGTFRPAALATRGQLCKCIVLGGHY